MNNHDILNLLDTATLSALFKLYNIKYSSIAVRLRCTKANITYKQQTDSWKDYELQIVLEILQQYGLEITELILINRMVNTAKKRMWNT
ncbi:hypothetical protein AA0X95_11045 [Bacillus sp. 1P10SD]|uniref:hypothetical protein n=1 Tax=Bacillus sp. 1P10SD TaxID=3132265 RepID=UPI0039A6E6BB